MKFLQQIHIPGTMIQVGEANRVYDALADPSVFDVDEFVSTAMDKAL